VRVLHVYSGNLFGGIESLLLTLTRSGSACGPGTEVALCFDGRLARELDAAGARVHALGAVRVSRPHTIHRARRALADLISRERFECIVCHAAWSYAIFARVIKRAGVPLVFWAHDAAAGRHWSERWARRTRPDLAIANSRFTAATLSSLFDAARVEVIYYPVEAPPPATMAAHAAVRGELNTAADAVVIAQVSRIEAWKGHRTLLVALAELRHMNDWVCWIVGGPQRAEERTYAESLDELARSLGIADRVRFAGERRDVPRIMAGIDVLCQPNVRPEPFGIALVEALAAGRPVVTSAFGGAVEIVDDSCGRLVPPGDRTALVAALDTVIVDTPLRCRLSQAAPARARLLCDPPAQMRRVQDCLESVSVARQFQ
jgi:glycosyltransferase involved in cell wall biosynthesis